MSIENERAKKRHGLVEQASYLWHPPILLTGLRFALFTCVPVKVRKIRIVPISCAAAPARERGSDSPFRGHYEFSALEVSDFFSHFRVFFLAGFISSPGSHAPRTQSWSFSTYQHQTTSAALKSFFSPPLTRGFFPVTSLPCCTTCMIMAVFDLVMPSLTSVFARFFWIPPSNF